MNAFSKFSYFCSRILGSPISFALAVLTVVVWFATGHRFGWSDTWQLIINTGTTILTFLAVFLIQNSQNRDTKALHAKLDGLIHATEGARNELIRAEEVDEIQIEERRL